jgi:hypothetical protein
MFAHRTRHPQISPGSWAIPASRDAREGASYQSRYTLLTSRWQDGGPFGWSFWVVLKNIFSTLC